MDKKLLGLAAGALMAGVGTAAAEGVMNPTSYAELLQPIPNAVELLKVVDATPQKAQFFFGFGDHHHHHHHGWGHHHHHGWGHHHHHGWYHHHHHGWGHHHHHHHGWGHHHHHH